MSHCDITSVSQDIAAGDISDPVLITRSEFRINVWLSPGATAKVYKSASPYLDVRDDLHAGRLTYANFEAADQSSFSSRWVTWSKGDITYVADPLKEFETEGPYEGALYTAVVVTATGGSVRLEVIE